MILSIWQVHSSSIMSVLHNNPGSFLLLVKNLLEYQDLWNCCFHWKQWIQWPKFFQIHPTSINPQHGITTASLPCTSTSNSKAMPKKDIFFRKKTRKKLTGEDVKVDWKLSWEDLKLKLRKLYETSEEAFNQFSLGSLGESNESKLWIFCIKLPFDMFLLTDMWKRMKKYGQFHWKFKALYKHLQISYHLHPYFHWHCFGVKVECRGSCDLRCTCQLHLNNGRNIS